jgi:hypothetical protein
VAAGPQRLREDLYLERLADDLYAVEFTTA